jgi:putative ABC transport system permease protein
MDTFMRELWGDIHFGCRLLLKNRAVTLVAVLALGLGIGANTAIFSVVNAVLLRTLPFDEPERVVTIRIDMLQRNIRNAFAPYPDIAEWRRQCRSFESLSAYSPATMNLSAGDEPDRASVLKVNAEFFPMLRVKMARGRAFRPEEDRPGAAPVAVLAHGLWQRRFGADAGVVGRPVVLDGAPYTVVGVLPAGFYVESPEVDLYVPIARSAAHGGGSPWSFAAWARLKPGVSVEQAQAELETVHRRVEEQYPRPLAGARPHIWGLRAFLVRDVELSLLVLLAAVALVLLIACANVANLLLARAGARQKEIGVRTALGAGRWRLVRQLLTESVILALAGGVLGVVLAHWGVAGLAAFGAERVAQVRQARLNAPVLAFTTALSLLTGLLFGIAPALAVSRSAVHGVLKEGGRTAMETRGRNRLRGLLVVSEVALALLLMVGASLLMRSFLKLQRVNPGFRPEGILTASVDLPAAKYGNPEQSAAFYRLLEERLQSMPGVAAAGLSSVLPLSGNRQAGNWLVEGHQIRSMADVPLLFQLTVNCRYFQAMQIPLKRGRAFTEQDSPGAPRVVIVNEALVRRYWPNENPVGKRIGNGRPDGWMAVVGVVGDVRHASLSQPAEPEVYFPLAQNPRPDMRLAVRTAADPLRFAPTLRRAVTEIDPDQPISRVATMEESMANSLAAERFSATLLGIFALLALVLGAIGIYGMISFAVTLRTQEIGVRMALGASAGDVLLTVVRQGALLALAGVAIGMAAAFGLTRFIGSLLYGVEPLDPLVFAGAPVLLTAVAVLASYIPARRASRVDPMVALRYE